MEREQQVQPPQGTLRTRVRNGLAMLFRHRRLVTTTLAALLFTIGLAVYLQPVRYEAQVKMLVRHVRIDSPVTPAREVQAISTTTMNEEELQSEVQILTSRDLLKRVAGECRIESARIVPRLQALIGRLRGHETSAEDRLEAAVRQLERSLNVRVVKKTYVVAISYQDADRARARCVLDTLSAGYIQKHMTLRHPPGAFAFFQQESQGYRDRLSSLKSQLAQLNRGGVASLELEKDLIVRKLRAAEAAGFETRAHIAEATERIGTLRTALAAVPPRRTTQVRVTDNGQLMAQLQSSLLTLEQKRTELLMRHAPDDSDVREVVQQIEQARAAIAAAVASPLRAETTDNDPTHEWIRTELARAEAELAALQARERAIARTLRAYREESRTMVDQSLEHEEILRQIKAEEETYLLYLRKQEEARISEALDQQHISDIAIAEPVNVPGTPTSHRVVVLLVGVFFSLLGSVLLAVIADAWDPTFRTPDELASMLGIPVLATLSKEPRVPGS